MSYFSFQGQRIYYREAGAGKPLLLLHGNTASLRMFDGVAERYAERFRVVLIDFLGHGRSDRLPEFPADLWFFEAQQVIAFLRQQDWGPAELLGSSGGALVALNVALEAPELVDKLIADSFEGEVPLVKITENLAQGRQLSKGDAGAVAFYRQMQGEDWQQVVDNDTAAILRHQREIGRFFHQELSSLGPELLLTGSQQDEFVAALSPNFFADTYGAMLAKIGHGAMHLFAQGGHPAMLSNFPEFYELSCDFLLGG